MKLTDIAPGKYIIAVSGGVDSIVLLHILAQQKNLQLVIAHFDHGIREDSAKDAQFVKDLANEYNIPFVHRRVELGEATSEKSAREARYSFLNEVKEEQGAMAIVTAHHADDVLETMIINIVRGTGWRGVSSLRSGSEVLRPLLHVPKEEVYSYAKEHDLKWHEDETNQNVQYLRNYIRKEVVTKLSKSNREELLALFLSQVKLRDEIEAENERIFSLIQTKNSNEYSRYFFIMIDQRLAIELLRFKITALRPQLERALIAVKTAKPDTRHQIGDGVELAFTKKTFIVVHPDNVVS